MANPLAKLSTTPAFERAAALCLVSEPATAARVLPHADPDRFNLPEVGILIRHAVQLLRKFGKPPSSTSVLQSIKAEIEAGKLEPHQLIDCAQALELAEEAPPVAAKHVEDELLAAARTKAVWESLEFGVKSYRNDQNLDRIRERIVRAVDIGRMPANSLGTNMLDGLQDRAQLRRKGGVPRVGTGFNDLDQHLNGGLAAGEIGTVLAGPKFGKSMMLSQIALHTVGLGGVAVYYTLELSEIYVGERMDAAISHVPITQLQERNDYVTTTVIDWFDQCGGQLFIKELPGYETSVEALESHLESLQNTHGVRPTVIIVDSADFMRPVQTGLKERYDLQLGSVYTELRNLSKRWGAPLWTASWVKREAVEKGIVTMADISDSWRKVGVSDLGIAICGTPSERESGMLRISIPWCRFAPGDKAFGPYQNDFACGRLIRESAGGEEVA